MRRNSCTIFETTDYIKNIIVIAKDGTILPNVTIKDRKVKDEDGTLVWSGQVEVRFLAQEEILNNIENESATNESTLELGEIFAQEVEVKQEDFAFDDQSSESGGGVSEVTYEVRNENVVSGEKRQYNNVTKDCYVVLHRGWEKNEVEKCKKCPRNPHTHQNLSCNSSGTIEAIEEVDYYDGDIQVLDDEDTGERSYACEYCPKKYKNKNSYYNYTQIPINTPKNSKIHKCSFCQKEFSTLLLLLKHREEHKIVRPFECLFCTRAFQSWESLRTHSVNTHIPESITEQLKFECELCKKICSTTASFKNHLLHHNKPKNKLLKCKKCYERFCSENQMKSHMGKIHGIKSFICTVCGIGKKFLTELKNHVERVHKRNERTCKICQKIFCNQNYLKHHKLMFHTDPNSSDRSKLLVKVRPVECGICKKIVQKKNFNDHMKIHKNERNFECDLCQKKFNTKTHLRIHIKYHFQIFDHECLICKKKFNKVDRLKIHMTSKHGEKKKFECERCGKMFRYTTCLVRHEIIEHKGGSKFICRECGKDYVYKLALMRHELKHKKIKRLKCDKCEKTYKNADHFAKHQKEVHLQHPYTCDICQKLYKTKKVLTVHVMEHLGEAFKCKICKKKFKERRKYTEHIKKHLNSHFC